jgi:spermidine synthase
MKMNETQHSPWYWRPAVVVFISNACIMVLELVAGRIIAPTVGVSLYTWTSVIGVVLAGMSLGNYLGGRLADRYASLRLLGIIYLLAGVTSLGVLGINTLRVLELFPWPLVAQILVLITILFFVPATILGAISPIVVKLALRNLGEAGRTVGRISAAGTAGSIVGTFITGFWLISWFGTRTVVLGVAVILLLMGVLFLFPGRRVARAMSVGAVVAVGLVIPQLGLTASPCLYETNYFCIKVQEDERDGKPVRKLILDRLVHSYNSVEDPTELVYGYGRTYAELTAYQAERRSDLRTFFIGGGGYTFPRYVEAVYPESEIDVVEIDPGVTEVAYEMLGLSRETRIVSYNEDARMFLERPVTEPYAIIFGDAFNDFSVPYHLTTREFNERVRAWLDDDGIYVVNIIDGALRRFLTAYVHTLSQTFDYVYVAPNATEWRTVSRDTFVIVASNTPLDIAAFAPDSRFASSVLPAEVVTELLAESRLVTLTDSYAPVEQMLAPVFLGTTTEP